MGGGVRNDFTNYRRGMHKKYDSELRGGSGKYVIPQRRPITLVLLGCSGNGKSATGNTILGKEAFLSKGRAAAVTKECHLQTATLPNRQIISVIDTPGLFSLFPSNESTIREILKCFRLAKDGIDAVLMVFSLRSRLTEEEKSVLFVLKILFGNDIVNYLIVVFTNEDSLQENNQSMKEYLEECPDFKEILGACNNRMVLFDNRTKASMKKRANEVQRLLDLVEVVRTKNEKPFTFDMSHETKENEAVFEEKKKKINAMKGHCTKQEMSNGKEEAEKSPQDQLAQMVKKVEIRLTKEASILEETLAEEKNARLEAKRRANDEIKKLKENREESNKEIKMLKEKLDRAQEELDKNKKGGSCIIL